MKTDRNGEPIGLSDKHGREILCGDIVLYLNESPHTKREFWYPLYRIKWDAPSFVLDYVCGGKSCASEFTLKHRSKTLLVLGKISNVRDILRRE